jgi:hypothetical protein
LAKKAMRGVDDPGYAGPRFVRVGDKGVLYLKEDLDRWLDQWTTADAITARPSPVAVQGMAN